MSASVSWVVFAIRRRSLPTRRVSRTNNRDQREGEQRQSQFRTSMTTMVAATVVTFDAIEVAVFVTTFCTPPDVVRDTRLHLARARAGEERKR